MTRIARTAWVTHTSHTHNISLSTLPWNANNVAYYEINKRMLIQDWCYPSGRTKFHLFLSPSNYPITLTHKHTHTLSLSLHNSIYLSNNISYIYISISYLSLYLSLYLSIYLYLYLSVYLSKIFPFHPSSLFSSGISEKEG